MNDSKAGIARLSLGRRSALLLLLTQVGVLAAMFNALGSRAAAAAGPGPVRIVAFGDSLTAGFGLAPNEAFPVQLAAALKAKGRKVAVTNAGVSGDTSAGGLARFDWAIPDDTEAVILELGANDALRGIDPALTRKAMGEIVARLKARRIEVLIAGMKAPSNWGDSYTKSFDAIFPELAEANGTLLYPFFLDGIVMQPGLNLPDGLHPTAKGVAEIVKRILPSVEALIDRVEKRRTASSRN